MSDIEVTTMNSYIGEELSDLIRRCRAKAPLPVSFDLPTDDEAEGMEFFCWLIRDRGKIISALTAGILAEGKAGICDLYCFTDPEYQREGYASELFEEFCNELEEQYPDMDFRATAYLKSDPAAEGFLTAMGFERQPSEYIMTADPAPFTDADGKVTYEKIPEEERDSLAGLYAESFGLPVYAAEPMMEDLGMFPGWYRIRKNGETAGLFLVIEEDSRYYLCCLGVLPEFRRCGCASTAVKKLLSVSRCPVAVQVSESNTPAMELYRKLGFQVTEQMLTYEVWLP